ncbi:MAG TPA: CapA family protein [Clostridiales bacterium]|nr:CapA family protein [Clostridiales bacterium]
MIKISFAGDLLCQSRQIEAYKTGNDDYDFESCFERIKPFLSKSDFVVANLETPLAGKEMGYMYRIWEMNTPKQFAIAAKNAGIDFVSTANNHCLDRGIIGLRRTIDTLDEIGFTHIGTYKSRDDKHYYIVNIKGVKVGLLSYTYGTNAPYNQNFLAESQLYSVDLFDTQEEEVYYPASNIAVKVFYKGKRTLRRIFYRMLNLCAIKYNTKMLYNNNADIIVMLMHAGGQYGEKPVPYVKRLVRHLKKIGIDVVIGNHEHRVQEALFENKFTATYALGDFFSENGVYDPPYDKSSDYSVLFHLYLSEQEKNLQKRSFSILKNVKSGGGKIQTIPVFDLLSEYSGSDKEQLEKDNLKIFNKFLNQNFCKVVPLPEYDVEEALRGEYSIPDF